MYRLAAFDLDGTLLNGQNTVSDANAEALRDLVEQGVIVAAATARSYHAAMRSFEALSIPAAAVASGGADVRLAGGQVVRQSPLPAEFTDFLVDAAEQANWTVTLMTPDVMYRRQSPLPDPSRNRPFLQIVDSLAAVDLSTLLSALLEPQGPDPLFEELLAWDGRVGIHRAASFNGAALVNATAIGADKGHGLRALCAALGIDVAEAVVFGDSEVDLPMFDVAGTSVAMANAPANVRDRATHQTAGADEDGVAQAIRALWS
ncbi:MAG: HAD family hydrolase [Dehalococcoidia bacterium]